MSSLVLCFLLLGQNVPLQDAMLSAANKMRGDLQPLAVDPTLQKAAQEYVAYLARTGKQGHFANGEPEGRAKRAGFDGSLRQPAKIIRQWVVNGVTHTEKSFGIGEVLTFGPEDIPTAFRCWRESPGHYAAIIEPTFNVVGCGYAEGKAGPIWIMMIGKAKQSERAEQ